MAPANSLDELRRRIGHGTTPVAFAALAEEHRRAGRLDEAVAVCREGLERYPTYASARVTLGRALLDLGDMAGALVELEEAVTQAPDNLAAARALETVRMRMGHEPAPASTSTATEDAPAASMLWMTSEPPESRDTVPATYADPDHPADLDALGTTPPSDALAWLGPVADEATFDDVVPSFASEWPEPADAPADDLADPVSPFEWGETEAPLPDAPVASWDTSVEEAVADVFAAAPGGAIAPDAADRAAPTDSHLDALQSLLESIRARRARLSEPQSGVD